ncbi:MAG: hypothetical protein LBT13_01010 [Treponema sp.]|jgi:hypothetical protein|nr:hypothetical protein [Treponema sp.]
MIYFGALIVTFISVQVDALRMAWSEVTIGVFIAAIPGILPVTLYLAILLGLNYTARKGLGSLPSMLCIGVLSGLYTLIVSLGIGWLGNIPIPLPSEKPIRLGEPGLILSAADSAMVLLDDPADIQSPRVISLPNQPLVYQVSQHSVEAQVIELFPAPFKHKQGIINDFSRSAEQFNTRLNRGFSSFIIYVFGLIFLLISLRFLMVMSSWPLANLCVGTLIFRGVLALEGLLNSPRTLAFLAPVLSDRLHPALVSPLAFYTLGVLSILFTVLIHLIRGRRNES